MKRLESSDFCGFFLSGFLLSLLGAVLPGWGFHLTDDHATAGWLFFAAGFGLLAAHLIRPSLISATAACGLAAFALLCFGLFPAPVRFGIQFAAWLIIGFASGLLNLALMEAIGQEYRASPSSAIARAAIYFLLGCTASALLVSLGFRFGFVSQGPAALVLLPASFGVVYWRRPLGRHTAPSHPEPFVTAFSGPGLLVVVVLLFLQGGSAGVMAGWLPIFLSHRIGLGPEDALWFLTLYWFALIAGLLGAWYLLTSFSRGRVLLISSSAILASCFLLSSTDNTLGAAVAIVLMALSFSGLSCLLAQNLSRRLPNYHPGVLNRIFTITLSGAFFSAWIAGLLASAWGLTAILILPAIDTAAATGLLLVLWLESKVTGR